MPWYAATNGTLSIIAEIKPVNNKTKFWFDIEAFIFNAIEDNKPHVSKDEILNKIPKKNI